MMTKIWSIFNKKYMTFIYSSHFLNMLKRNAQPSEIEDKEQVWQNKLENAKKHIQRTVVSIRRSTRNHVVILSSLCLAYQNLFQKSLVMNLKRWNWEQKWFSDFGEWDSYLLWIRTQTTGRRQQCSPSCPACLKGQ